MKKNINKVIAMTMALAVVGGTVAFANNTTAVANDTTTVVATPPALSELTVTDTQQSTAAYITTTGKITTISTTENGNKTVTLENETGGLIFVVAPTTMIADRATSSIATADTLTEGMTITVVYSATAPMGMSLPPYLGNPTAVIANADKGNINVGLFNDEFVNEADKLQLNIDETTTILTTLGTRSILSAEDVKGKNAVVFYDITTRSIPAQTTPSFVLLLEEKEAVTEVVATEEGPAVVTEKAMPELVALRDAAEAKGYKVVWQGNDKPIVVEKEGTKVEITTGSASYVVDGTTTLTAAAEAILKDGVLCVSSDVIDNLK